ncbi:MAG TPA: hypothetical protein VGS09_02750 [Actinomycetota bacterium]|nr:hypothetical protein [Actinomycetota bacterium]
MAEEPSAIRFKRGDVEFELSGSQSDVAKAWEALGPSVVAEFERAREAQPPAGAPSTKTAAGPRKKAAARKRPAAAAQPAASDVRKRLMDAKLDSFPEIGRDPPALSTGYAVLRWARTELSINELTVPDIHAVAHRLRIPHSVNAYREAFRGHARAVNRTNKTPQTYELMNPGEDALDTYLASVAAGGSGDEAEAKAAEAEERSKA